MRQSEILIEKTTVQFLDPDNIEHEKVFRLLIKKFTKIGTKVYSKLEKEGDTGKSVEEVKKDISDKFLDTDLTQIPIPEIIDELLDDEDFDVIRDIMLKSCLVTGEGLGLMNSRNKINALIGQKGFHFLYRLIWEACRSYLGEHWSTFLESESCPESVKEMLKLFSQQLKSIRLSSLLSSVGMQPMEKQ